MFKNVIISSIIAVVLIVGASQPVSALTADEIQAQVKILLEKITELAAMINKLKAAGNSSTPVSTSPPAYHRICTLPINYFAEGDESENVRAFQEFLQAEGYLNVAPTGYYGAITKKALANWQAAQGFESAGVIGPKTLERIRFKCGFGGAAQFSASPTYGAAPLSVTFRSMVGGFRPAGTSFTIDFGDGTSGPAAECSAPADACVSPGVNVHVYSTKGTYTATLSRIVDPCFGQPACRAAVHQEIIGKVQITVGGGGACTKEYKPVCGAKPVVCITYPCNPVPTTYSNRCMMENDSANFLYEGTCRSTNPADDPQCKQWFDGCNTCSRTEKGGIAACTLKYCAVPQAAYCTGYFDNSNRPPSVTGISGPTTLAVNQMGTWSVTVTDPENGPLSYSINWGEPTMYAEGAAAPSSKAYEQTSTFSHTYAAPGTYTITVTATDNQGATAKASVSVKVGGDVVCAEIYQPVCGRPSGCANTCASGQVCPAICQLKDPQTFGNRCQLNSSGAQYLHEGQCTATSGNWH